MDKSTVYFTDPLFVGVTPSFKEKTSYHIATFINKTYFAVFSYSNHPTRMKAEHVYLFSRIN